LISIIDNEWLVEETYYKKSRDAELSYIHKFGNLEIANNVYYSEAKITNSWMVHLQKEFESEGYRSLIDKHGGKNSFWKNYSDTTSGEELSLDSARVLVYEEFKNKILDYLKYELLSESTKQRPSRSDHFFTWRDTANVIAEAFYTRFADIHGDQIYVSNGSTLNIPESWKRSEMEKSSRYLIVQILSFGLIILLTVRAMYSLGHNVIKHKIRWRAGWIAGGITAIVLIIGKLNELPSFYFNYNSSVPINKYLLKASLTDVFEVLAPSLFIVVAVSLAEALIRSNYRHSPWLSKNHSMQDRLDDFSISIGSIGMVVGVGWLLNAATDWFNLPVHNFDLNSIGTFSLYSLALGKFVEAFKSIPQGTVVIILILLIRSSFTKIWVRWLTVILVASSIIAFRGLSSGNLTSPEFIWWIVRGLVFISAFYYIVSCWIRHRLWLLITMIYTFTLANSGLIMLNWKLPYYHNQAIIILVLSIIPIGWIGLRLLIMQINERHSM